VTPSPRGLIQDLDLQGAGRAPMAQEEVAGAESIRRGMEGVFLAPFWEGALPSAL